MVCARYRPHTGSRDPWKRTSANLAGSAKVAGIAREKHRNAVMVLGKRAAALAAAERVEFIVLAIEPAGRFVRHILEPCAEVVTRLAASPSAHRVAANRRR